MDARALASPNLSVLLAGNKLDLASDNAAALLDEVVAARPPPTPSSTSSKQSFLVLDSSGGGSGGDSVRSTTGTTTRMTASFSPQGREVSSEEASRWAAKSNIPAPFEVSALTGEGVDELFTRLARIILTKIELGEIDPDDPQSGIQYGDGALYAHGTSDVSSIRSGFQLEDSAGVRQNPPSKPNWKSGMREWEDVFRLSNSHRRECC